MANHEELKRIRGRGDLAPGQMAALVYLRELEAEMVRVQALLSEAWIHIGSARDFHKASKHMDSAQQRMHRVIKRIAKKGPRARR